MGCFSSTLSSTTVAPREVERLRILADKHLPLSLKLTSPRDAAVGYQYILLALPVARVYAPSLLRDLIDGLTTAAASSGYSVDLLQPSQAASPRLEVVASDITVSGYDLLVVRRPSASITLKGTLSSPAGVDRVCEVVGSETRTSRFAFTPELEEVLRESVDKATRKLLSCLFPEAFTGRAASDSPEESD